MIWLVFVSKMHLHNHLVLKSHSWRTSRGRKRNIAFWLANSVNGCWVTWRKDKRFGQKYFFSLFRKVMKYVRWTSGNIRRHAATNSERFTTTFCVSGSPSKFPPDIFKNLQYLILPFQASLKSVCTQTIKYGDFKRLWICVSDSSWHTCWIRNVG